MENVQEIILSNKRIKDSEIISFVLDCFREVGGVKYVSRDLEGNGFKEIVENAYPLLDEAKETQELNLEKWSSMDLRLICTTIITALEDCKDLEILMMLPLSKALDIIRKI